jgi:hypothetical protein
MKALILENKVVDLSESEFEVAPTLSWMDCSDDCKVGWTLESGVLTAPPESPELTYAEKRAREYPALAEQLDMLFHDMTAEKGTKDGEWYKAIEQVKSDNPKPE